MKNLLLKNWTLWRMARMVFAIVFIVAGIIRYDTVLTLGGVFLFFHALLNRCAACVGNSCDVSSETRAGFGK